MSAVAVIDYGIGNVFSVCRALQHMGARVQLTCDSDEILKADRVVLPGVGAFKKGMERLTATEVVPALSEVKQKGTPLLGICLGMQMLMTKSFEHGEAAGLNFIPGSVVSLLDAAPVEAKEKIPHIGWAALSPTHGEKSWQNTPHALSQPGDYVYFVHSWMARPDSKKSVLAQVRYGELDIVATIGSENVFGTQFHPERSCKAGLRVIEGFLKI